MLHLRNVVALTRAMDAEAVRSELDAAIRDLEAAINDVRISAAALEAARVRLAEAIAGVAP